MPVSDAAGAQCWKADADVKVLGLVAVAGDDRGDAA